MPAQTPSSSKGGMLSLYANLLDPDADNPPGTIARAPVVFKQPSENENQEDDAASKKQQISAASVLRFQPTKRPQQLSAQKPKAKPSLPKPPPPLGSATAPTNGSANVDSSTPTDAPATTNPRSLGKTTLADWATVDDDVNEFYRGEKRQRGGRKKRKKNRDGQAVIQNWDDIYDPSRPNSYEEYKHSDEKIREVREWKDRLYAHRMARRRTSDIESDEEEYARRTMTKQFAPPPAFNFAPPPTLNEVPPGNGEIDSVPTEETQLPEPAASIPDDQTGDDAYTRRLKMSQKMGQVADGRFAHPPPPPPPPPPPESYPTQTTAPAQIYTGATISRPPVRYALPSAPEDIPATEAELEEAFAKEEPGEGEPSEESPRSLRPGQERFAERLLAKYGWTKGSGLGATRSGIVKPLQVKVEKQKKKPDSSEGVSSGPRGRIIGGKQKLSEEGKFGRMSNVVMLHGMVEGMDLDVEMEGGEDGGLIQEIGEECGEKYGRVERVFIDRSRETNVPVFIKFTEQLSALRAVNALEGRIFNGNAIRARFYDTDKFEKGVYAD